jgi:predicted phosphodiesterase
MSQPAFFAILSDIHSNIDALDAVLADIAKWPVRGIVCLGDIVGYGAEPAQCLERIREISAVTVMGNHEAMLPLVAKYADQWHETVAKPLALANRLLSDEQKEWIRKLPLSALMDPITLSHCSLHDPTEFHYVDSTEEAEAHFAEQKTPISFQGHTHIPVVWEERAKEISGYLPLKDPVELDETCR